MTLVGETVEPLTLETGNVEIECGSAGTAVKLPIARGDSSLNAPD